MSLLNWIIKQLFYLKFLWLKMGKIHSLSGLLWLNLDMETTFFSQSFEDGQWSTHLPWYDEGMIDYNTYGKFKQQYGKFYFKVKLNEGTNTSYSAIWLLEISDTYYYEVDIEMFPTHFGYTIWKNNYGTQDKAGIYRADFWNKKLYKKLQDEHLFCIDWNKKRIKMYIDGLLTARFKDVPHVPMQIVCSNLELTHVIVEK